MSLNSIVSKILYSTFHILYYKVVVLGLLLFCPFISFGDTVQSISYDSSLVVVRYPSNSKINEYKQDSDFIYDKKLEDSNFVEKFFKWLMQWYEEYFADFTLGGILIYIIIAIVAILLITKILRIDVFKLFYRSKRLNTIGYKVIEEDINKMDLDSLIAEEIDNKRYRKAVRYLYLKLLKILNDNGKIDWCINKTNHDYCDEIKNKQHKTVFKQLSHLYEYIWYGDFKPDKNVFFKVNNQFQTFYKQIH